MIEAIAWILVVFSVAEIIFVVIATKMEWEREPYNITIVSRVWINALFVIAVCGRVLGWW